MFWESGANLKQSCKQRNTESVCPDLISTASAVQNLAKCKLKNKGYLQEMSPTVLLRL